MNAVGAPSLPATWRPRRGRVIPHTLAIVVPAVSATLAVALPQPFQLGDRIGFVVVGLLIAGGLYFLGHPRLTADEHGLTVVNVVRRHQLEWAEVVDVTMTRGEPWPTLDLADGTTLAAMGIQASDGERARTALAELEALLHERGEAVEPDQPSH
ncbi:MAG: PH domain-containing protein [Streptosporangiales bacterium]|nr:PH domain-containing protein [Streptosporangiales bacterium]